MILLEVLFDLPLAEHRVLETVRRLVLYCLFDDNGVILFLLL